MRKSRDPLEHAADHLKQLPDPPWEMSEFSWPSPSGNRDDCLSKLAASLGQAAAWVEADEHGPRWLTMLREFADHLDHKCGLPCHGAVVKGMVVPQTASSAEARLSTSSRLRSMAAGIKFYTEHCSDCSGSLLTWEAPMSWPPPVRQAAHAIGEEIVRAARYCGAWSSLRGVPNGHPCQEIDTAEELWSRPYAHRNDYWLRGNCRVIPYDGDRLWACLLSFLSVHRQSVMPSFDAVRAAVELHNERCEKELPPRSLVSLGYAALPAFVAWSQELIKLSDRWAFSVCCEPPPSTVPEAKEGHPVRPGLETLRERHPVLLSKSGPLAILRVLLSDPDRLWSAPELATELGNRNTKGSPSSAARWLEELKQAELAQQGGKGTAKRWRLGDVK